MNIKRESIHRRQLSHQPPDMNKNWRGLDEVFKITLQQHAESGNQQEFNKYSTALGFTTVQSQLLYDALRTKYLCAHKSFQQQQINQNHKTSRKLSPMAKRLLYSLSSSAPKPFQQQQISQNYKTSRKLSPMGKRLLYSLSSSAPKPKYKQPKRKQPKYKQSMSMNEKLNSSHRMVLLSDSISDI
eukprot:398579_1